jgi:hypothetical protein
MPAVRAGEPASPRLGDALMALRAGGGRPPLVHEHHADPGKLRLVRQAGKEMGAPPVAQRQVLAVPACPGGDALGIADDGGAHPLLHQPGHHGSGCLVVGLADPAAVAGLGPATGRPVAAPAPAAPLALARCLCRRLLSPALGVLQVQALLGPDRSSRDEEALVAGHHGIGVDDAEVDACHLRGVMVAPRHGDLSRHVEEEPSRLGDQGDRADRLHRVGDGSAEAHPQLGVRPGHAQADPGPVDCEAPPSEANRDQAPLAAGEAGPDTSLLAFGCLEECGGVVLQDRLGALPGQITEGCARELPAQGREARHLGAVLLGEPAVPVDHPGPHIPRRSQEAVAAAALGRRGAQGDPGGAVDLPNGTHVRNNSERNEVVH